MTFDEAMHKYKSLNSVKGDYSQALESLRGRDWEQDVLKDTRLSVQKLYEMYKDVEHEMDSMLGYIVLSKEELEDTTSDRIRAKFKVG
jgi:uncharacterized protein YaaN involved in tellurite resistance